MNSRLKKLLERISPTIQQKIRVKELIEIVELFFNDKTQKEKGNYTHAEVCGSYGKGTFLRKSRQLDIFFKYSKGAFDEKAFSQIANLFGHAIQEKSRGFFYIRCKYTYKGITYDVDLVPYETDGQRPVDRTVLHKKYILDVLREKPFVLENILLLKYFLKKTGLYGAETHIKGFSGYCCQVLMTKYESIEEIPLDLSRLACPVEPKRDLLASASVQNITKLIIYSRNKWRNPFVNCKKDILYQIPGSLKLQTSLSKNPSILSSVYHPLRQSILFETIDTTSQVPLEYVNERVFKSKDACYIGNKKIVKVKRGSRIANEIGGSIVTDIRLISFYYYFK